MKGRHRPPWCRAGLHFGFRVDMKEVREGPTDAHHDIVQRTLL